ncbi:Motile sperm domain-containing protein 2-like protein [Dinothrombium tinctorium]|uniref:Motile sperm domain-containing protein 2-like protein n=1 Tax=Dinothrombium tinctorium TaxID=1965070 RepID=A0A443R7U9_9ACAR|nr:Motile sperm domain-containing protein 2-like protein [Dinothrombium tinctorium]
MSDECLNVLQKKLIALYENDGDVFDENDFNKIVLDEKYLKRFLLRQNGDLEKAFEFVKETLIWRKEEKLSQMTDASLPRELYEIAGVCIHGTDFDGNAVLYLRCRYATYPKEAKTAITRSNYYLLHKAFEKGLYGGDKGWVMVLDFTGIKFTSFDPQMTYTVLKTLNRMPSGLSKLLLYNFPWYGKPFLQMLMSLVPKDWTHCGKIVNKDQILQIIPSENLPVFFENPSERHKNEIPSGAKYFDDMDKEEIELYGLKSEHRAIFKKYLTSFENI